VLRRADLHGQDAVRGGEDAGARGAHVIPASCSFERGIRGGLRSLPSELIGE
jgi:hypothetical protein